MLVAGGAANSVIIFHAESVKVPVNCTLTSVSELEAALPKELLPISALGKRIHHCRPRETAKSFPELPAAKSPPPPLLSFLSLFFPPSEGEARAGAGLFLLSVGLAKADRWPLAALEGGTRCPGIGVPTPARQHGRCARGPGGEIRGPAPSLAAGALPPLVSSRG